MPTNETTCSEPCPSALLVAFVSKSGTVKNHNPEDIEIDPCTVANVEIVPVEVCVNYDPITGENDYSALYIRYSWSGIWLKLDGICSNNNQCGYPIIYERTFTANYYLDEYDMGDGEIWYDEWYDFCGELKVFMMLPQSRPYTFCDIELAKLFYPLYSPTNIVFDIETGYPAIFDCRYLPPSPSTKAMEAVNYYWMPTYQWQLVPACKLEVYYDESYVLASDLESDNADRIGAVNGDFYNLYYYLAFWTDIGYEFPYSGIRSLDEREEYQSKTIYTRMVTSLFQFGAGNDYYLSTSPLCADINATRMSWIGRLNAYIDEKLYGEDVEYIESETPSVRWLGWNPDPWGGGRTNCDQVDGGAEWCNPKSSWNSARITKRRCRIKVTKPEEIMFLASGVVLRIKVTETYNDTSINNDYRDKYLINTSREPVVISDEEVTVAFGETLEYEATKNIKDIVWNEFPDCPDEDAIGQFSLVWMDFPGGTTCSQRVEVRLIRYIC